MSSTFSGQLWEHQSHLLLIHLTVTVLFYAILAMFTDNHAVSGHQVVRLADKSECPVKEVEKEMKQEKGGERRKEEEANGRGAATGVLVHGLVTQD